MNKIYLRLFGIFIFLILILSGVLLAGSYSQSNVQRFPPGTSFSYDYGIGTTVDLAPHFTEDVCASGQDFIIQIPPLGCEPAVIRSDLLEEQDVPVFCKLSATQLNPLVDVGAIEFISFDGDTPAGVRTVGFHPARAAIKQSDRTLLNSPILQNVGYAVIVLNQNKNESSMPDWVGGEMTAKISYDVKNAFGIGRATYHLPVLDDKDWGDQYSQYGFWNGKGYIRAKAVSDDQATIAVYSSKDNQVASTTLEIGADSEEIFLPGFYCMAGLNLRLRDLEDPSTMVRLEVGGDTYDVSEGEDFLDGACSVKDIQKEGLVERTSISCKADDGIQNFDLDITPEVNVDVEGVVKTLKTGDVMYSFGSSSEKKVYLGYVGQFDRDYFMIPVVSPERTSEDFLNSAYFRVFLPYLVKAFSYDTSSTVLDIAKNAFVTYFGALIGAGASLFSGTYPLGVYYVEGTDKTPIFFDSAAGFSQLVTFEVNRPDITFLGFKEPENMAFSDVSFKDNFDGAMKDYESILESFSAEKDETSTETYGERALIEALKLCKQTHQSATYKRLCLDYRDNYKDNSEVQKLCDYAPVFSNSEIASNSLLINGDLMTISLQGVFQPDYKDYGVEFNLDNAGDFSGSFAMQKGDIKYISDSEFIVLQEIRDDRAVFDIRGVQGTEVNAGTAEWSKRYVAKLLEEFVEAGIYSANTAEISEGGYKVFGDKNYRITVKKINLNKNARVDIIPDIEDVTSEANFTFKIGIEKRAIQLSPKQTKDLMEKLDAQIKTWKQISDGLGTVVKTMKGACLGVGAIMTIKSFISNTDGKAIARQEVMEGESGWIKFCEDEFAKGDKKYNSVDHCLLENNDLIEEDVRAVRDVMGKQGSIDENNLEQRLTDIRGEVGAVPDSVSNALTVEGSDAGLFTPSQLMDLERYSLLENSGASPRLTELAQKRKQSILSAIEDRSKDFNRLQSETEKARSLGLEGNIRVVPTEGTVMVPYEGQKAADGNQFNFAAGTEYQMFDYNGVTYVTALRNFGEGEYGLDKDQIYTLDGTKVDADNVYNLDKVYFRLFSDVSYHNQIDSIDLNVKYFNVDPYKGLPALVPFDKEDGWYVRMKQSVSGFGGIQAYDDSGRIVSFELCNVMEDGRISSDSGYGDDQCMKFNPGVGQVYGTFPGLDTPGTNTETNKVVNCAVDAIEQASQQSDNDRVSIRTSCGSGSYSKGTPAVSVPEMQCQDFMSPKDCNILFNVCDPVICPPSRCNLGGAYYVDDVIQSGIIGSLLLCLPNAREKIFLPVCLTGVQAGVDGVTSVMQAYHDCLQDSLENGETVGVCDEIHSVYLCEMFWRQGLPFAKVLLPKVLGAAFGEGGKGGGEYLNVASAWQNAENSYNYFTQYYGRNSYNAFKIRSMEDVGTEVCRASLSTAYPSGIDFFNNLVEPDSPVQYTGRFDEIPFTTATVPPISQYKVYYHIFAGKDAGAYYQVYLKSEGGFYGDNPKLVVNSGYVARGKYADETKDLTAPAGYGEMCIVVNGKEDCGFKQVSSSFAVDYIEEAYLTEQSKEQVTTTEQCESGSSSIYSLLSPNLQEGVDDVLNPELYNHGIIRVCATDNPGLSTDPSAGGAESRWKDVGYCDNTNMRCWIDTQSVKDQIKNLDLENEALDSVTQTYLDRLKELGQSMNEEDFLKAQQELNEMFKSKDYNGVISYVTEDLIKKALFNSWKAYLHVVRGNSYSELAKSRFEEIKPSAPQSSSNKNEPSSGLQSSAEIPLYEDIENGVDSAIELEIFPVSPESIESVSWNFGEIRSGGRRCHAGVDIHTKNGGKVLATADGTVKNIYSFTDCSEGSAVAVIVDHGSFVVNYGEIDAGKVKVKVGDKVKSGDTLGYASVCGMLHFELYKKGVTHNIQWGDLPGTVGAGKNYCREHEEFLAVKDKRILDPTNTLLMVLEGVRRSTNSICFETPDSFINDRILVSEGCFNWDESNKEWYFISEGDNEQYSLNQVISSLFISDEIQDKAKELKEEEQKDALVGVSSCGDCGKDEHWYTLGFGNICGEEECRLISDVLNKKCSFYSGPFLVYECYDSSSDCDKKTEAARGGDCKYFINGIEGVSSGSFGDDDDGDSTSDYDLDKASDLSTIDYGVDITSEIINKFVSKYMSDVSGISNSEKRNIVQKILENSKKYKVPPHIAMSVARQESSFSPCVLGDHNRALGLYQIHQDGYFSTCAQKGFFSTSFSELRNDLSSGTNCHIPEIVGCGVFALSNNFQSCNSWEGSLCKYNTNSCSREAQNKFCYVQRTDSNNKLFDSDYVFEEVMKQCGGSRDTPGNCFKGFTGWN